MYNVKLLKMFQYPILYFRPNNTMCIAHVQLFCKKFIRTAVIAHRAWLSCSIAFHYAVCYILCALVEQINDGNDDD